MLMINFSVTKMLDENLSVKVLDLGDSCPSNGNQKQQPSRGRDNQKESSALVIGGEGKGKTVIVDEHMKNAAIAEEFVKRAQVYHDTAEVIQISSQLVDEVNRFVEDKATFMNQDKVKSVIMLIKKIERSLFVLCDYLKINRPAVFGIEWKSGNLQADTMMAMRMHVVSEFLIRLRRMTGTPRRRADRIISELGEPYATEFKNGIIQKSE